jgi:serine/threonine-protein kinase
VVEPGRRCLGDRYELHRLIAAGGMGQVWRGFDIALHRPVAVKVLRSEYTGDPTFVARFRAEAQHAASLSHPNIARVFDYGEEITQDGTGETLAYLVMELVEGEPLSALLRREGPLDTQTTLSLLRQTAFGLAEAHRAGMVHRDVKPGNILVRPDGGVKITDFGIAWSARSVALTRTGQVIGTPQYLSPEQAEGRPATPASDVYALGLIGYECLAGHPAFDGDNAVTIALKQVRQEPDPLPEGLPHGIRGLVGRALAKDPASRLPDGAAVVAALDDLAEGREIPPPPATVAVPVVDAVASADASIGPTTSPGVRSPLPRQRRRGTMVLLPLLGLLAGAGIAVALFTALTHKPLTPVQASEQRNTNSIVLKASNYVGRPVDDVTSQLSAYGLTVQREIDPSAHATPGTVTRIDPVDKALHHGDRVTVFYMAGSSGSSAGSGSGVTVAALTTGAGAPTSAPTTARSTAARTSHAAATTTPAATAPASSAPATTSGASTSTAETTPPTSTSSDTPTDTTPPSGP